MSFDLEDWRAIACGYAASLAMVFAAGSSWLVPAVGIGVTLAVRRLWR